MTAVVDRTAGMQLVEQGTLVEFEILEIEVVPGSDEGEFGVRAKLRFGGEDEGNDIGWGGLGFMFVLAVLSCADARPRGMSGEEYLEQDELTVADFLAGLTYVNGRLRYHGDYVRGRRMKTSIVLGPDSDAVLEAVGRGKAALHWLDRLKGEKDLRILAT